MKFWNFTPSALAGLLAVVALAQAAPGEGEAKADPNSAVVHLTAENFQSYITSNPLVLAEFFAPWCGYCKMLGPEYSKASDILKETNPNIKLAQIDCVEEEQLCQEFQIKGYPTLKIFREGAGVSDYEGPREAAGIADYMFKQALPAVQVPEDLEALDELIGEQTKPFVIHINPAGANSTAFEEAANVHRKDYTFISVTDKESIASLTEKFENVKVKKDTYYVVHPDQFDDVRVFTGEEVTGKALSTFIVDEVTPYFGDINRDTYMAYMTSTLPIAYYFYNTPAQQTAVTKFFNKLGKQHKGKINFVGLDATLYGRHAEVLSMDPEIIPFFAIQNSKINKKYGVNQTENPDGPSEKVMSKFVKDFLAGKVEPIIKSEPLPTPEEVAASPVVRLVAHNYNDVLGDITKDVFVKYYAPWCSHCKKLAPIWEELASIYKSDNKSNVVIADIDHSNNDVDTTFEIEGYPTLLLYPANGLVDEKTGLRVPHIFDGPRDLDGFVAFVKKDGAHKIDGQLLKRAILETEVDDVEDEEETKGAIVEEEDADEVVEQVEPVEESAPVVEPVVVEDEDLEHDEL